MEATENKKKGTTGILKHEEIQSHANDHVKFDEEIIAEHDKDRGTRQKIDEPKTPYANEEEDEQMQDED